MAISDQSISTTASSPYGWPADSRVLFTTTDSTDYTVFCLNTNSHKLFINSFKFRKYSTC